MNHLYRSKKNRIIGGVAGGMAEYASFDVSLMRLIWILAIFLGVGVLAYLICLIVIPEISEEDAQYVADENIQANRRRNFGLILIAIGLLFLIKNLIPWPFWEKAWPLLLVAFGLYVLLSNRKGDQA